MQITKEIFRAMLRAAAKEIVSQCDHLNRLDSEGGDGDHGTAMSAATQAAHEAALESHSWSEMCTNIGMKVMGAASGSTSALVGSFYIGMADALKQNPSGSLDADELIAMFESGLANLLAVSRAKVGDKTLLDAIVPAVESMSEMKGTGSTITEIMKLAAQAAQAGAEATKDMVAKVGRAKNIGERSRGKCDAGASSFALMFQAFSEALGE